MPIAALKPLWAPTESGCSVIEFSKPPTSALALKPAPTVASPLAPA